MNKIYKLYFLHFSLSPLTYPSIYHGKGISKSQNTLSLSLGKLVFWPFFLGGIVFELPLFPHFGWGAKEIIKLNMRSILFGARCVWEGRVKLRPGLPAIDLISSGQTIKQQNRQLTRQAGRQTPTVQLEMGRRGVAAVGRWSRKPQKLRDVAMVIAMATKSRKLKLRHHLIAENGQRRSEKRVGEGGGECAGSEAQKAKEEVVAEAEASWK